MPANFETARLQLGIDNYAIRSLGWKAPQLIDYAASLALDVLMISDVDSFERQDEVYLRDLRKRAEDSGLRLQAGMLSICPTSSMFDARRGEAAEQLRQVIRIARGIGSPIARCVLGIVGDRRSAGGIAARIAETVAVLREVRSFAVDHEIKIAVENHAGDMRARELVALIEEAGSDFVGALIDAGNAAWALEDPVENLETLAPYALTTGIRDSVLWPAADGAVLQWAAVGEGAVDFQKYFETFARLCPRVPVVLETISGRPIPIPFRAPDFWSAYGDVRAGERVAFEQRVARGTARPAVKFASDASGLAAERGFQKAELERSVRNCRERFGIGRRRN